MQCLKIFKYNTILGRWAALCRLITTVGIHYSITLNCYLLNVWLFLLVLINNKLTIKPLDLYSGLCSLISCFLRLIALPLFGSVSMLYFLVVYFFGYSPLHLE